MNDQCRVNIEDTAKAKPKEAGDANANQYQTKKLCKERESCTRIAQLSTCKVEYQPKVVELKAVCTKKCMNIMVWSSKASNHPFSKEKCQGKGLQPSRVHDQGQVETISKE